MGCMQWLRKLSQDALISKKIYVMLSILIINELDFLICIREELGLCYPKHSININKNNSY